MNGVTDQELKQRRDLVFNLFRVTWTKISRELMAGASPPVLKWLTEHHPDLIAAIDETEKVADAEALRFLQGQAANDADLRKAGKAWWQAWVKASKVVPKTEAPQPKPAQATPTTAPKAVPRDFKELGCAVHMASDDGKIDFWLVGDYTGEKRAELSADDLLKIERVVTKFPGAKITDFIGKAGARASALAEADAPTEIA